MRCFMKLSIKFLFLFLLSALLSACSFFDKDNTPTPTPLAHFTPEINVQTLWYKGTGFGVGSSYLKLSPAVGETMIFSADKSGRINAFNKITGQKVWTTGIGMPITAGTTAGS